jgi:hypothetical protein
MTCNPAAMMTNKMTAATAPRAARCTAENGAVLSLSVVLTLSVGLTLSVIAVVVVS